jgi:hypothetical protein
MAPTAFTPRRPRMPARIRALCDYDVGSRRGGLYRLCECGLPAAPAATATVSTSSAPGAPPLPSRRQLWPPQLPCRWQLRPPCMITQWHCERVAGSSGSRGRCVRVIGARRATVAQLAATVAATAALSVVTAAAMHDHTMATRAGCRQLRQPRSLLSAPLAPSASSWSCCRQLRSPEERNRPSTAS